MNGIYLDKINEVFLEDLSAVEKYKAIGLIATSIYCRAVEVHWWKKYPDFSEKERETQKFYNKWAWSQRLGIEPEDYPQIIEEGLNLIKFFINSPLQKYEDIPGLDDFMNRAMDEHTRLSELPKYRHLLVDSLGF